MDVLRSRSGLCRRPEPRGVGFSAYELDGSPSRRLTPYMSVTSSTGPSLMRSATTPRDTRHATSWPLADGWLLLTGSLFTGEFHRPAGTQVSASDIDFLWLSRRPVPARSSIQELSRSLARLHRVRGFHHASVKWVTIGTPSLCPPWMTNAWVPAIRFHLRVRPDLALLVPPCAATFRPLEPAALAESIDTAWTYAALSLANAHSHTARHYAVSKLLLVLANVRAQLDSILPTSYCESVRHLISTCHRLQSSAEHCYRVKTGSLDMLSAGDKESILLDIEWLSETLLSHTRCARREPTRPLRQAMLDLLRYHCPQRGTFGIVASELRKRATRLPRCEETKRARYLKAAEAYDQGDGP